MAAEIRVNKINNRAGLGTITIADTGVVVNGIVTCTEVSGLNVLNIAGVSTFASTLDINGDIDVDGHTNLDNVSISGVVTATTFVGNGDFVELDVDGHTNLDNVSIAGLSTHSEGIFIPDDKSIRIGNTFANPDLKIASSSSSEQVVVDYARSGTGKHLRFRCTDLMFENYNGLTKIARFQGGAGVGHAELYYAGNKKFETTVKGIQVGTGVTVETNGQATFTGIVTASAFKLSDGSNVGGVESDAQSNTIGGTNAGINLDSDTYSNTFFGHSSGKQINSGDGNTAVGQYSLQNGTSATENSCFGYGAGRATTSNQNTLIGYAAATDNSSGTRLIAVGYQALKSNTTANDNIAIGNKSAFLLRTGARNVIMGTEAAYTGPFNDDSVIIGYKAGYNLTDDRNVLIGFEAGHQANDAQNNVLVGYRAGRDVTTGDYNVIIGDDAGNAGTNDLTTGQYNIIIGHQASASSATVSNEITFGNSNINHVRIPGIGVSFSEGGAVIAGVVTATSFSGDGSNLSNLPAGAPVGGASTNTVFFENDVAVAVNYQVTSNKNAMSAGPIAINAGIAVTVPSGSSWTIV